MFFPESVLFYILVALGFCVIYISGLLFIKHDVIRQNCPDWCFCGDERKWRVWNPGKTICKSYVT